MAYLAHLEARRLAMNDGEMGREEETSFLKHPDDRADQFLTDEDGTIIGIIDWEW